MKIKRNQDGVRQENRRGAAVVEMAMICVILFMMLFGILEYCRFLFVYHITNNACRDAARFAVVHTSGGTMPGEPATITTTDIQNIVTTGMFNGSVYGTSMCGMQHNISGYTVSVFNVDPAGLALSTPVVQADPTNPSWTSAAFQQKIAVRVTGTYQPILPTFLMMNANVPFNVTVIYSSEAN